MTSLGIKSRVREPKLGASKRKLNKEAKQLSQLHLSLTPPHYKFYNTAMSKARDLKYVDFLFLFQWLIDDGIDFLSPSSVKFLLYCLRKVEITESNSFSANLSILEKESGLSVSTILKCIEEIETMGKLKVIKSHRKNMPDTYALVTPYGDEKRKGLGESPSKGKKSIDKTRLKELVRSILFVSPKPIKINRIFEAVAKYRITDIYEAIEELKGEFRKTSLEIYETAGGYSIGVRENYNEAVARLKSPEKRKRRLSDDEIEVLAIALYKGPISRQGIDSIRGKQSPATVNALLRKKLIEAFYTQGTNNTLLRATGACLDYLGIKSLADLPSLDETAAKTAPSPTPKAW